MERFDVEKIITLEEKMNLSIDLLEIAKTYCESNYDKSSEFTALWSMLDIILKNQKEAARGIDNILAN